MKLCTQPSGMKPFCKDIEFKFLDHSRRSFNMPKRPALGYLNVGNVLYSLDEPCPTKKSQKYK